MITFTQLRVVPNEPPEQDDRTRVLFSFDAPNAESVHVVGSFNDWNREATPMGRAPDGEWRVHLHLPAGLHRYRFVINGRRSITDPRAKLCARNGDGSQASVLVVRGAELASP